MIGGRNGATSESSPGHSFGPPRMRKRGRAKKSRPGKAVDGLSTLVRAVGNRQALVPVVQLLALFLQRGRAPLESLRKELR